MFHHPEEAIRKRSTILCQASHKRDSGKSVDPDQTPQTRHLISILYRNLYNNDNTRSNSNTVKIWNVHVSNRFFTGMKRKHSIVESAKTNYWSAIVKCWKKKQQQKTYDNSNCLETKSVVTIICVHVSGKFDSLKWTKTQEVNGVIYISSVTLDTYAIICSISVMSVHAFVEAKRTASVLKKS